ncbi:extracellular solute-binding protein [Paenibacillus methanolicus]|uniref:Raffinose/stachyose/melibiose transport system substrate-binding protein n=1 Tax=Paenibacillus methanolicus TaxID=582686 RepID=A0A5S5C208_9BACL|nr:extracellular solute-binding protein [Paenibacillus methanolicus]TYP73344.1 raffinose/stachyose/melibiose transport system substrate-binding protein [Paenibacillus methanolicus]
MGKRSAVLGLSTAAALLLSACSNETAPTNEAASGEGEAGGGGKISITLMHRYQASNIGKSPEDTAVLDGVERFKKDFPDVEIVEEQLQNEDYAIKAQALAAADDMPDVFIVPGSWMTNFVDNEIVLQLNEELDKRPEWRDGYRAGTLDAGTREGKVFGIPIAAGPTHLIYYNADLFADIGYDQFPATWDEVMDAGRKLADKGVNLFSYGDKSKGYAMSSWISALTDRHTGPEWTASILSGGGAAFTDPGFVNAISIMSDLSKAGYLNKDMNSVDGDTMVSYYFEGRSAAFVSGIWSAMNVVNNAPEAVREATKVAVFPGVEDGKGDPLASSGGAGVYYSVHAGIAPGPKLDAIMTLLEYMTGSQSAKLMAEVGGFPAYDPGEFDTTKLHPVARAAYEASAAADATKIFDLWFDASIVEVINTEIQGVMSGSKTPAQLAEAAQQAYETFLAKP